AAAVAADATVCSVAACRAAGQQPAERQRADVADADARCAGRGRQQLAKTGGDGSFAARVALPRRFGRRRRPPRPASTRFAACNAASRRHEAALVRRRA
ncbi:hypothetical protein LV178_28560, partial [Burkholderia mallei]|nr:hypothetical protein [Burkholderia mallei]